MLLDGVFVASQIESDTTDLRQAFATIAIAVKATGEQLLLQAPPAPAGAPSTEGTNGDQP